MRVVLAEDSVLLREGLIRLIEEAGCQVVAAVGDGPALVAAVAEHAPDVSVVDIRMPPSHTDEGLRAAVEIRRRAPGAKILVLSQYVEVTYAGDLFADRAGGVGYLLKDRWSTSTSSPTRCAGWPPGAPCWTRRWWPSCSRPAGTRWPR